MLLVILWCFILANVKILNSLSYDGTQYRIYPRLDFTCANSTFNFEFNINTTTTKSPRLLAYQDQNGKMKYFLVKLTKSTNRLVFSDHWNQNVEIPIDLSVNQWYKFIYRRKIPIGTSELLLQQLNNNKNLFTTIFQKDLTADLSKFGVLVYDFTNLFIAGLPALTIDKSFTVREVKTFTKFNGQLRNIFYSNIEQQQEQQEQISAVSLTCDCEQLAKRQFALFNNRDSNDACEYDFNKNYLCSKDCTCLTTGNTKSDFRCDCIQQTSSNCESSG